MAPQDKFLANTFGPASRRASVEASAGNNRRPSLLLDGGLRERAAAAVMVILSNLLINYFLSRRTEFGP